jgi:Na+/melibiose symporter-like transporter
MLQKKEHWWNQNQAKEKNTSLFVSGIIVFFTSLIFTEKDKAAKKLHERKKPISRLFHQTFLQRHFLKIPSWFWINSMSIPWFVKELCSFFSKKMLKKAEFLEKKKVFISMESKLGDEKTVIYLRQSFGNKIFFSYLIVLATSM